MGEYDRANMVRRVQRAEDAASKFAQIVQQYRTEITELKKTIDSDRRDFVQSRDRTGETTCNMLADIAELQRFLQLPWYKRLFKSFRNGATTTD
jgi:hypothetical protein